MTLGVVLDLADTETNVIATLQHRIALIEDFLEPRHDRCCLDMGRTGEQCHELITAQAPDHVTFAKGDTQHIGEGFQRAVTLGMPITVVDRLEVVEVEEQQRRRPRQAITHIQGMLGQRPEATPIG
ncbi:hypothetical protein D3C76_960920 [compost metagenome]